MLISENVISFEQLGPGDLFKSFCGWLSKNFMFIWQLYGWLLYNSILTAGALVNYFSGHFLFSRKIYLADKRQEACLY